MKIIPISPLSWASNCYAIINEGHALIVDPSISCGAILSLLEKESAVPDAIILTHGHFDHIVSLDTFRKKTSVPAMIHKFDADFLGDAHKNAFFDFFGKERSYADAEILLEDGDEIELANQKLKIIHTPGHTNGSICILGDNFLVTGDTLFEHGYGRYDLYSGNADTLFKSLKRLASLDPSLIIYPGHQKSCTLAQALENINLK